MRPLPILILMLAAFGLLSETPGINEAYRLEVALALLAFGGVLTALRGFAIPLGGVLWDSYSERRPALTLCGAAVIVFCLGMAYTSHRNRVEIVRAKEAGAQLQLHPDEGSADLAVAVGTVS